MPTAFLVVDKYIYQNTRDELIRIDMKNNSEKVISREPIYNFNLSYSNGNIHFIDKLMDIYSYSCANEYTKKIGGFKADKLFVDKENIYFANMEDNERLYFIDKETLKAEKVMDCPVTNYYVVDNYVYYISAKDGKLYKMDLKTGIYKSIYNQGNIYQVIASPPSPSILLVIYESEGSNDFDYRFIPAD